jgi:hypothetical protein
MKILCDLHHADLWWSLQLLANRLGATLFRPYGMEWYDHGYYKIYGDLRRKDPYRYLAKQYLEDTIFDYDGVGTTVNLKTEKILRGGTGIGRETYNGCKDYPKFNLLTLEQAKNMDIDIVICSVHENEPYFAKLKEFYPNAKFIRQVGNDLDTIIDEKMYPNLLSSAMAPYNAFSGHKVLYRQEFDLNLFQYKPIYNFKNIYSFQNDIESFEDTWAYWTDLKHKLRDYNFKSYGVGCDDGKIYPKRTYIEKVLESTFVLQSKGPWEGYGHTIHSSICLGRPMIIKFSDYKGKLAEPLLIENETYLEMDENLPEKLRSLTPEKIEWMSKRCHEKEFVEVKKFFDELI